MNRMIKYTSAFAVIFLIASCGEKTAQDSGGSAPAQPAIAKAETPADLLFQARAYRDGSDNMPVDKAKALELFIQADQKGESCAAFFIGVMYENGETGAVNLDKALEWLTKADKAGCGADANRLPALKAKMKKK